MDDERFITSTKLDFDNEETTLRPKTFDEYVGQEKMKHNLKVFIEASKKEARRLITFFCMVLPDWAKQRCLI